MTIKCVHTFYPPILNTVATKEGAIINVAKELQWFRDNLPAKRTEDGMTELHYILRDDIHDEAYVLLHVLQNEMANNGINSDIEYGDTKLSLYAPYYGVIDFKFGSLFMEYLIECDSIEIKAEYLEQYRSYLKAKPKNYLFWIKEATTAMQHCLAACLGCWNVDDKSFLTINQL